MKKAIIKLGRGGEVRQTPDPHSMSTLVQVYGNEIEISDGYHTMDELYDHRITLYIALCKSLTAINLVHKELGEEKVEVWKSEKHSDGLAYNGWFILGIGKNEGSQITYHLPMERWEECDFAETLEKAPTWDKHTPKDVLNRLKAL